MRGQVVIITHNMLWHHVITRAVDSIQVKLPRVTTSEQYLYLTASLRRLQELTPEPGNWIVDISNVLESPRQIAGAVVVLILAIEDELRRSGRRMTITGLPVHWGAEWRDAFLFSPSKQFLRQALTLSWADGDDWTRSTRMIPTS